MCSRLLRAGTYYDTPEADLKLICHIRNEKRPVPRTPFLSRLDKNSVKMKRKKNEKNVFGKKRFSHGLYELRPSAPPEPSHTPDHIRLYYYSVWFMTDLYTY